MGTVQYFDVVIEVDEKRLKKEYPGMELIDAVKAELNWLHDNGVYVITVKPKK